MQASREEVILLLKKWRSASSEIRCSVIRDPDFQVSLSVRVLSIDETGVVLSGPNDNRVLIDLSRAEFEFLDSLGISHPVFAQVAESFVEGILGIFFRDIALNFILAAANDPVANRATANDRVCRDRRRSLAQEAPPGPCE